jgi:parallel beta-helix repeat protein
VHGSIPGNGKLTIVAQRTMEEVMKLKAVVVLLIASNVVGAPTGPPPGVTPVHYVSPDGAHVSPFTIWENAANDIQSAVDASADGDMVLVGDGTYSIASEIVVDKEITVQSVNGPEVTVVDGGGSIRCFNLDSSFCTISGITITNGYHSRNGGGVYCSIFAAQAVLTNCIVTGNVAGSAGGGMIRGIANNCMFINNSTLNSGGGKFRGVANNCMFFGNSAASSGGGMSYGMASNSKFEGNIAKYGGGLGANSIAHNCTSSGNWANRHGGGIFQSVAQNCTISGNSAAINGGGMYSSTAYNCTISGNSAATKGGGMYRGTACNSIIWHNWAGESAMDLYRVVSTNSCAPDVQHGFEGNITNAPVFIDPENGDYRLLATSPCIDAGSNDLVTTATDLDGNDRIIDGDLDGTATVDMGAYEFNIQEIPVDIMVSTINPGSKGRTPVAVITTDDFDATTIDPASVRFAGAAPVKHSLSDVDGDGDIDLKLHFMTADLGIAADGEVTLIGQTQDGVLVVGMGTVKVVSGKSKLIFQSINK